MEQSRRALAISACAVHVIDTLPAGTQLYARTHPFMLLIARAWWAALMPTERYATLAALANSDECSPALLPPMQWYGRGQQIGQSDLAEQIAALPPALWQALVNWTG